MRLAGRVRRVEAVVDMQPVGCSGTNELVQVEVFGKSHRKNFLKIDKTIRIIRTMQMASDHL